MRRREFYIFKQKNQSNVMKEIVETISKMGISLSDGELEALEESCIKVEKFAIYPAGAIDLRCDMLCGA